MILYFSLAFVLVYILYVFFLHYFNLYADFLFENWLVFGLQYTRENDTFIKLNLENN